MTKIIFRVDCVLLALLLTTIQGASHAQHAPPTLRIQSRVAGGPWERRAAVYPLKGQRVVLKTEEIPEGDVRWFQIFPDVSKVYKNANHPWEKNPYKWVGFGKITYYREELVRCRGRWTIEPFAQPAPMPAAIASSPYFRRDVGSFWFQVEATKDGKMRRSPGIEDSEEKGLSPAVMRVSVRNGKGYLGHLTSFMNVPGLFGCVTYQSTNYIGVDCADVLVAAHGQWRKKPVAKNHNVAMLVEGCQRVAECDIEDGTPGETLRWDGMIRPGDLIAVRYRGARQFQHIGALFADANRDGLLDPGDQVIHAGPVPLHVSRLSDGNFNGRVVILRWKP